MMDNCNVALYGIKFWEKTEDSQMQFIPVVNVIHVPP